MNEKAKIIDGPGKQKKIDEETAEKEFYRFCNLWDIDDNQKYMTAEDIADFDNQKRRMVKAISKGLLTINDDGTLNYTLYEPVNQTDQITFKMPNGKAWTDLDKYKTDQLMHKTNVFFMNMTGQYPRFFAEMHGIDMKFCQALIGFFLGS